MAASDSEYTENLSSPRTEALFIALMILFLLLFLWRYLAGGLGLLGVLFGMLFLMFAFYAIRYRTLHIKIDQEKLTLRFGLSPWVVPLDNIASCRLDELPAYLKYGGAGVHFMSVGGRYRASFNFLEYPRVVIELKQRIGPVMDISFSTRQPDEIIRRIEQIQAGDAPTPTPPG